MRYLVTGSSGFIGQNLVKKLAENPTNEIYCVYRTKTPQSLGARIKLIHLDLNKNTNKSLPENIDTVFHLAASSHPNADNPYSIFINNVNSTTNLLACYPKSRFVFASSIVVYGDQYNSTEQQITLPTTIYGASKAACDNLLKAHNTCGGGNTISLRLSAVVGKNMTHGFLPVLLKKLDTSEDEITLLGGWPGTTKPYTHIDDVIAALIHSAQIDFKGPVNYCAHDCISISSIAEYVMLKLNKTKSIKWTGWGSLWPGDNRLLKSYNGLSTKLKFPKPRASLDSIGASL